VEAAGGAPALVEEPDEPEEAEEPELVPLVELEPEPGGKEEEWRGAGLSPLSGLSSSH